MTLSGMPECEKSGVKNIQTLSYNGAYGKWICKLFGLELPKIALGVSFTSLKLGKLQKLSNQKNQFKMSKYINKYKCFAPIFITSLLFAS